MMDNQERVIRDGNTYVRFGDKWYLIDGPVYDKLEQAHREIPVMFVTLFSWDGEILDRWTHVRFLKDGKPTDTFSLNGELPPEGRYAGLIAKP